jgi:hypothetical protein
MVTETWRTDNVSLAAFLALSFDVLRVEWVNRSVYWVFEESDELISEIDDYHNNLALADPKAMNDMVAEFKRQIFRLRDEQVAT